MLKEGVKRLREQRRLKPIDVAYNCKITEKYYKQLENQDTNPSLEVLTKLADFFEVSIDALVGRTGDLKQCKKKCERDIVMLPPLSKERAESPSRSKR